VLKRGQAHREGHRRKEEVQANEEPCIPSSLSRTNYQPLLRRTGGKVGLEEFSQLMPTSAASSLALLEFLPSYQKRADNSFVKTFTVHDQAVRPPAQFANSNDTMVSRWSWSCPRSCVWKNGVVGEQEHLSTYLACPTQVETAVLRFRFGSKPL